MTDIDKQLSNSDVTTNLINLIINMPEDEQIELLNNLEAAQHKKERIHLRKHCSLNVQFFSQDCEYSGLLQDISYSGGFIKTGDQFSEGQEISLIIPIAYTQKNSIIAGNVARIDQDGIGIKFDNIDHNLIRKYEQSGKLSWLSSQDQASNK